jgi:hypothetical protein
MSRTGLFRFPKEERQMTIYSNRYYHNARLARRTPVRASSPVHPENWESFKAVRPEIAAWIEAKASTFEFAAAMLVAVQRFGDLTENQAAAVQRCVERDAARQAPNSARQTPSATFPAIRAAFDQLVLAGGRKPITIGDLTLSLAPASGRNAGAIYVKSHGAYVGKIVPTQDGPMFMPTRECPDTVLPALLVIEADPRGAVQAHAARIAATIAAAAAEGRVISMPCGCCGLTLTDPVSIARGIGPVCSSRWGF